MMENTYWNSKGKHQEWLDAIEEKTPSIGYTGNPYMDALLAAKHLYHDAYNNGGGNIECCYMKDVQRFLLPLLPNFSVYDFISCRYEAMEKAMDTVIELLLNKDLRFKEWAVDVHERVKYVMFDPESDYEPTGAYVVTFGNPKERDDWLKARLLGWPDEKNTLLIDRTQETELNTGSRNRLPDLEAEIAKLKAQAIENGAELELEPDMFIDAAHLDCVWYGHDFGGVLRYKGYSLVVGAFGEVRLYGAEGTRYEGFSYVNKKGDGANESSSLRKTFRSDAELNAAISSGEVLYENNNWLEYEILDEKRDSIWEPEVADTDNLLEFFSDIKRLVEEVMMPAIDTASRTS